MSRSVWNNFTQAVLSLSLCVVEFTQQLPGASKHRLPCCCLKDLISWEAALEVLVKNIYSIIVVIAGIIVIIGLQERKFQRSKSVDVAWSYFHL